MLRRDESRLAGAARMMAPCERRCLIALCLAALTLLVFSRIVLHSFVNLDDPAYITENAHVKSGLSADNIAWAFTSLHASNWHPLTWLSHMLDAQLFGLRPGWHHLVSLLLHAGSAVILFLTLEASTSALWPSAAVAALFALHPLHVESVAWLAERKDLLSGFFWMLTMAAYIRYTRRPRLGGYLPVFVLLALGLMAKPMLVTLPFVLLLLDGWPLGRWLGTPGRRTVAGRARFLLLEKLPLLALSAASSVITYTAQQRGGAVNFMEPHHMTARLANASLSYLRYIQKAIWPWPLAVPYPISAFSFSWPVFSAAAACLLAITALSLRQARRRPWLAMGWLWYLGTLVPVIGLVQVGGQSMADRYTYLTLTGLFFASVWGLRELAWRLQPPKEVLVAAGAVILLIISLFSWNQAGYWKNSITLLGHTIRVTERNWLSHNNLGVALAEEGKLAEAETQYRRALEFNPDYAEARYNLGNILMRENRPDEAIDQLRETTRLKPGFAKGHNNLGLALAHEGRTAEAKEHFLKALALDPGSLEASYNMGYILYQGGRLEEAAGYFRKALDTDPTFAQAHNNLGIILMTQGRTAEALGHFSEAVRLAPEDDSIRENLRKAQEELKQ